MRLLPTSRARWGAIATVALLAVAVPSLLAFEAARAASRHRLAAERALRDHAMFAATEFRQRFVARVYSPLGAVFRPVGNARLAHPAGALPELALLRRASEDARRCEECGAAPTPTYFFRFILADSALEIDGPALPDERREWLIGEVANLGDLREDRAWDVSSTVDTLVRGGELVYVTVRRGPDGLPRAVYGFAVPLDSLRARVLRPVAAEGSLLALARRDRPPNDSLLSVEAVSPDGRRALLLTPRRHGAAYSATIPGSLFLGGWRIRVALDPRTAPPVLIGGLPPSRTGLYTALVLITAVLVGATVFATWRALALARLRAEFVASVSHELRTPLAQIVLFGETLTLGRMHTRDDVRSAGSIIIGEARRLMQLVDNVLLFGRGGSARRSVAPLTAEPLAPLVREVVERFAPLADATESRVRMTRLDDVTAPVDRPALRQILLNLLDNAAKYGPPGQTISIGLALVEDRARLWVEDEGPGIPPADRARVWRPFVRLERDAEAQVGGSGIGLSVVRDLIERMSGFARIESTAAGGACVIVELPNARLGEAIAGAGAEGMGASECVS